MRGSVIASAEKDFLKIPLLACKSAVFCLSLTWKTHKADYLKAKWWLWDSFSTSFKSSVFYHFSFYTQETISAAASLCVFEDLVTFPFVTSKHVTETDLRPRLELISLGIDGTCQIMMIHMQP